MSKVSRQRIMAYGLIAVMLLSVVALVLPKLMPSGGKSAGTVTTTAQKPSIQAPPFSGDSAFVYVKKQVDFGPRVPGSAAHKACADWLVKAFEQRGMTVLRQPFKAKTYFGTLDAVNIVAQYKPELPNRILLCAHWDSRHIADKDNKDKEKPIDGADDGASGVAVMLELARMVQQNPVNYGIDFICFDAEDLGDDRDAAGGSVLQQNSANTAETWCLGSQYWGKNPHKPGYRAKFGILLDMVGAAGARFPREGYSMANAPDVVNRIWGTAAELGYQDLFTPNQAGGITDDHYYVMKYTQIPTVDIIGMPKEPPMFGDHHHTHFDNISIIDSEVMRKVGHVVATVIYRTAAQPM
ncbi:MAG: M28 family peptidase [Bacteroidota bacterium]|nr:M28 family peptidase [Saprospiraceae bacterium]